MGTFRENLNGDVAALGRAVHRHPLAALAAAALIIMLALGMARDADTPPKPIRVEIVQPSGVPQSLPVDAWPDLQTGEK